MARKRERPLHDRSGNRTHFTHAYLRRAAQNCLLRAEAEERGAFYEAMLAILSIAFTAEAYLNYAGPRLVEGWNATEDEWLSPREKLKRIATGAGLSLEYSGEPYQSYLRVFELRKQLVHGRTTHVSGSWHSAEEGDSGSESLNADWMNDCEPERARTLVDGVEAIIRQLHILVDPERDPFLVMAAGESSGR